MPLPLLAAAAIPAVSNIISSIFGGKKQSQQASSGGSLWETALPSLIQGGTGLLGGFLSGIQQSKDRKQAFKDWEKSMDVKTSRLDKINAGRYKTSKDLSTIDPMLKKLFVGRISETMSPETANKFGIDFSSILSSFGGNPSSPTVGPVGAGEGPMPNLTNQPANLAGGIGGVGGGLRGNKAFADQITKKYGLML